jgi:hypothetical protein
MRPLDDDYFDLLADRTDQAQHVVVQQITKVFDSGSRAPLSRPVSSTTFRSSWYACASVTTTSDD